MERTKNLPFANYDIAVYLPAGAVLCVLVKYLNVRYFPEHAFFPALHFSSDPVGQVVKAVLWLSVSYLAGHLAAFASSYLVEKFVHGALGYPSTLWCEIEDKFASLSHPLNEADLKAIFVKNIKNYPKKSLAGWVILIVQIPASLILICMLSFRIYGYYVPKLPLGLRLAVEKKMQSVGLPVQVGAGTRWEKVVEHYVANHCPAAYTRMYNYLIIYGTLRSLAVIVLAILWWLFLKNLWLQWKHGLGFNLYFFSYFWLVAVLYVMSVMAFAKFNRRYFEECILAFLLADKITGSPMGSESSLVD